MSKPSPEELQPLAEVPTAGLNEESEGIGQVKDFLARFGYLPSTPEAAGAADAATVGVLDDETSMALARYQTMHGLSPTGIFDEATKEMASRARCGFPDVLPGDSPAFSITCTWNTNTLTYAFDAGTDDVGGDDERAAVRRAFASWSAVIQIAFREVGTGDDPDILIRLDARRTAAMPT